MSDEIIECLECGRQFIWTHGEQRYYSERGLSAPKRCRACRARRRLGRGPSVGSSGSPTAPRFRHRRQRNPEWWANATHCSGLLAFGLAALATILVWWFGHPLNTAQSWCIAITVVTFLVYAYDKVASRIEIRRVPETVLLALAAAGGAIGALAGMLFFRHKTAKGSFQLKLLLIIVVQSVLIIACLAIMP